MDTPTGGRLAVMPIISVMDVGYRSEGEVFAKLPLVGASRAASSLHSLSSTPLIIPRAREGGRRLSEFDLGISTVASRRIYTTATRSTSDHTALDSTVAYTLRHLHYRLNLKV